MISYILNFVLCSGLMLGIYYLLLASESLYRFNRFYLLFGIIFSLLAPLLTIQTAYSIPAIEEAIPFTENIATNQQFDSVEAKQINPAGIVAKQQTSNYQPYIIGGIYILIALALLVRFVRNIYHIYRRRALCYTYEHEGIPVLLLPDDVAPHSFLNNIFIGEKEYNIGIDPQIICHERAHVEQLHSIDIIIVELLQIAFWFNPLIPLYRKAIQLNHEFLADEAVVKNYEDMPEYQQLLLIKSTQNNNLNLTSHFNYLTLKKRLIMMTKTTSAKTALGKKLLVLPAIAVALLLSCDRNSKDNSKTTEVTLTQPTEKHYFKRPYSIKHSATPAPQQVLDDYATLLRKYDITESAPEGLAALSKKNKQATKVDWEKTMEFDKAAKQKLKDISAADRSRMNALFYQMDSIQQMSQYLRFVPAQKPMPKNSVTAQQLARWGSSKEYLVFLDNKPTPYTELAKYKPEDFDWGKVNRAVNSQGRREGFKYKVELLTKSFYNNYYNKIMANQDDHIVHHMKTGEKSAWLVFL